MKSLDIGVARGRTLLNRDRREGGDRPRASSWKKMRPTENLMLGMPGGKGETHTDEVTENDLPMAI